jgi:hypothetical protein
MYAVKELEPVRRLYAVRDEGSRSPQWPRLVRERAVEQWPDTTPGPEVLNTHQETADTPNKEDAKADDTQTDAAHTHPTATVSTDADPLTDPDDELFALGERCARAYMQADALQYQAMRYLAEFHHRRGWQDTGYGSTAEWLAWRIGIKPGPARERLRTALALEQLPETSEAMKQGDLSFTKVRALTRVATPDNEAVLLEFARAGSASNLERVVRGWKTLDRKSEVTAEQIRHRSRRFSAFVDDDGMVVVTGRLDPEVGALFMRAVEAATDALYREGVRSKEARSDTREEHTPADLDETKPEQRRADAVGLLAERALAAGFGDGDRRGKGRGKGNENGGGSGDAPISGSRAERYQVMLHVDPETLKEEGDPGQSELEDGTRVSAATSRRVACDAGLVKVAHASDGQVLGASRRNRTVAPSIRRALEARDRGCRFPGCGLRFTEAHHVKHWADGGETNLRNLVLLCRTHHRAVHEGGVTVCIDRTQQVVFFTPRGKALSAAPPRSEPPRSEPPTVGLTSGTLNAGESGNGRPAAHLAGAPRWNRDADIPWALEARAWEALDPG